MSRYSRMARLTLPDEQLQAGLPYEKTPERTLFSTVGVLIGAGVVTFAFGVSEAKARSALDVMDWLPQQAQLTQGTASDLGMAGAVGISLATKPAAVSTMPRTAGNRSAMQMQPGRSSDVMRQPADQIPGVKRQTRFADIGMTAADGRGDPEGVQYRGNVALSPAVVVATAPARLIGGPLSPGSTRNPEMPPDPPLSRDSAAFRTSAIVPDDPFGPTMPPSVSSLSAMRAVSATRTPDAGRAASTVNPVALRRDARSMTQYPDWLDDGSGNPVRINDPIVPEQAVRAALRTAADIANARSPAVKQARNDWDAARFDVDQVKGQRYPQVQVYGNQYNKPTASVAITTLIYDWGKTRKTIDSRGKTADAAEFRYRTVVQQNAYDVSSALIELAKNRAIYAIGESYVERMSKLVNMLAEIVKVDPGRLSELTQAKSRLLQAQTSQEIVATTARSLELSVSKLMGREQVPMPAGTRWQLSLDGLDEAVAAVRSNPGLEQLTADAEAAKLTAKAVRADALPKLNWVINKNTAADVFGNRQPWSTMLQLSWTPFQGGSQRAAERAALARADSSTDKRDQLALDAEFKVRDAYHDAIALDARAKLYGGLARDTDLIRRQFFEQWYHLNRRTLLDVLSAESDFYNNQVNEVAAQFDSYQSILKIHFNNGTIDSWLQSV